MEMGNTVKVKTPVIQGEIIYTEYCQENRCLKHKVQWQNDDGDVVNRWYLEGELEVIEGGQ